MEKASSNHAASTPLLEGVTCEGVTAVNETMKSILNRRSIRAFEPKQIPDEELQQIVEAGRYAATGMGAPAAAPRKENVTYIR